MTKVIVLEAFIIVCRTFVMQSFTACCAAASWKGTRYKEGKNTFIDTYELDRLMVSSYL